MSSFFPHIFFSSVIPSFLFFTPSKITQNSFTTRRQILDVLFLLIFISIVIYTSFFTLNLLYLFTITYLYLYSLYTITGLDKLHAQRWLDMQNLWDAYDFSGAHILTRKKEKNIKSSSFQSKRKNNEKVTVSSKYYHEDQLTCNILIKFTYLKGSKLSYLLMDRETFN